MGWGDKGIVVQFSIEENAMFKAFWVVKLGLLAKNRNTCETA